MCGILLSMEEHGRDTRSLTERLRDPGGDNPRDDINLDGLAPHIVGPGERNQFEDAMSSAVEDSESTDTEYGVTHDNSHIYEGPDPLTISIVPNPTSGTAGTEAGAPPPLAKLRFTRPSGTIAMDADEMAGDIRMRLMQGTSATTIHHLYNMQMQQLQLEVLLDIRDKLSEMEDAPTIAHIPATPVLGPIDPYLKGNS